MEAHNSSDECISQCRIFKENVDKQHAHAEALERKEQEVKALVKQSDEAVIALKHQREETWRQISALHDQVRFCILLSPLIAIDILQVSKMFTSSVTPSETLVSSPSDKGSNIVISLPRTTSPRHGESSQVPSGHIYRSLSSTHPSIVQSESTGKWVELRCWLCGAIGPEACKTLPFNLAGLKSHLLRLHASIVPPACTDIDEWIVSECEDNIVATAEVRAIKEGLPGAFPVTSQREVSSNSSNRRSQTLDEDAEDAHSVEEDATAAEDIEDELEEDVQVQTPGARRIAGRLRLAQKLSAPRMRQRESVSPDGSESGDNTSWKAINAITKGKKRPARAAKTSIKPSFGKDGKELMYYSQS